MRKLKTNRAVTWVTNEDVFRAANDAVRVNLPHPALADFLLMVGEPDGQPEDG